jgi:hypothetical protein
MNASRLARPRLPKRLYCPCGPCLEVATGVGRSTPEAALAGGLGQNPAAPSLTLHSRLIQGAGPYPASGARTRGRSIVSRQRRCSVSQRPCEVYDYCQFFGLSFRRDHGKNVLPVWGDVVEKSPAYDQPAEQRLDLADLQRRAGHLDSGGHQSLVGSDVEQFLSVFAPAGKNPARRRNPANRLVADELEAHWNRALQQVADAQVIYERQRLADRVAVDADTRARILALATDFPRAWYDPHTPDRERKRMVRLCGRSSP